MEEGAVYIELALGPVETSREGLLKSFLVGIHSRRPSELNTEGNSRNVMKTHFFVFCWLSTQAISTLIPRADISSITEFNGIVPTSTCY